MSASAEEGGGLGQDFWSVFTRTRYVLGNCGMRFRMRVVFPLPKKPVMMVTGTGAMLAAER
jgi:hypothetical protein